MTPDDALSDVRVVSLGQAVSGPMCSALLADLGADVIKVESPSGDSMRGTNRTLNGHPFSILYEQYNRNKRSVSVDVKREEGLEILYDLVETADVFLHNFQPGVANRLEIDEPSLRECTEELIYVSVSGYGESGPLADQPAFDALVQHAAGFASLQGYAEDPPQAVRGHLADFFAGYNAAVSILAALYHRDLSDGPGQKAEISMFDSIVHTSNAYFELFNNIGELPEERSREDEESSMYGAMEAKDEWIAIAFLPTFPNIWTGFCELMDRPDLLADPRFETPADRGADETRELLHEILSDWLQNHTADEAVTRLNDHGIPAAHHRTLPEVVESEHAQERELFVSFDHPQFGQVELTDTPLDLSETPPSVDRHSPLQGEHTKAICREIGYDADEIERLAAEDVLSLRAD
jgi:CoA:oxalate CoA-transferase